MKQDSCMVAQEKLHPVCAQRIEGSPPPTCLSLAEVCRENKECRFVNKIYFKTNFILFIFIQGSSRIL